MKGRIHETCSSNTDHPLPISEAALSTLTSIHQAGVLHGDIRPDNILIGDSGVTIIDFGHARQCSSKKAKGSEHAYLQSILQGFMGESQ